MKNTVTQIIDSFKARHGTLKDAARALGVNYTTVVAWEKKGRIPVWRMDNIRAVAKRDGIQLPEGS